MIFKQFYLGCLAHASYLIGDESTGCAWIIDPQRDIQNYLDAATELHLKITDVALTHLHADFVAGHLELRDRVGARVHLGAQAKVAYAVEPATDGLTYNFGAVRIVAWHTPGHTPEGITWLVYDLKVNADVPFAALTGDTLFIGDVGRPDLLASAGMKADDLAGMLYDSTRRLLTLDDNVAVYPAHGAGSMCGKNLSKDKVSSIGRERTSNYALQPMDRAEFIRVVTAEQPPAPAYFAHDVAMNKAEHNTSVVPLKALTLEQVLAAEKQEVQILDTRDSSTYAAAHFRGAINIGIDGQFAMWVGAVLQPERSIVIIAEPGREVEVVLRLRRVGFDEVLGYLDRGMADLVKRNDLVTHILRHEVSSLKEALVSNHPPLLIDVRNPSEFEAGHIDVAQNIPLPTLLAATKDLPRHQSIVVHCAGGYRSMIAASILAAQGLNVSDLIGGYGAFMKGSV
jgi:hydroxyacylglutathione hydrolase